jgi:hypothetical protein
MNYSNKSRIYPNINNNLSKLFVLIRRIDYFESLPLILKQTDS